MVEVDAIEVVVEARDTLAVVEPVVDARDDVGYRFACCAST